MVEIAAMLAGDNGPINVVKLAAGCRFHCINLILDPPHDRDFLGTTRSLIAGVIQEDSRYLPLLVMMRLHQAVGECRVGAQCRDCDGTLDATAQHYSRVAY